MKRALAERAKQSETTGHAPAQNGLGPQAPPVSSAELQPPRKVPRVDGETSQPAANQAGTDQNSFSNNVLKCYSATVTFGNAARTVVRP